GVSSNWPSKYWYSKPWMRVTGREGLARADCSRSKYMAMAAASAWLKFNDGIRPAGRALSGSIRNFVRSATVVFLDRLAKGTEDSSSHCELARSGWPSGGAGIVPSLSVESCLEKIAEAASCGA